MIKKLIQASCDVTHCGRSFPESPRIGINPREIVRDMKKAGWMETEDWSHICPYHIDNWTEPPMVPGEQPFLRDYCRKCGENINVCDCNCLQSSTEER